MQTVDPSRIFAHRGASGHAPENTLAAFRKAHDLGAAFVEFDCMLSRDGAVVVVHDERLDRIAGIDARVCDLDLADLQQLDAGSWFSPDFKGETIPTLDAVIALLDNCGMGANVEIKPAAGQDIATGEAVIDVLEDRWPSTLPAPVISSFSEAGLTAARNRHRADWQFAMLWDRVPRDWQSVLRRSGAEAVHASARHLDAETAHRITETGAPLRCYTVNDPTLGHDLFGLGVDAIFTDFPDRFLKQDQPRSSS